jgi:hypothetical protein
MKDDRIVHLARILRDFGALVADTRKYENVQNMVKAAMEAGSEDC